MIGLVTILHRISCEETAFVTKILWHPGTADEIGANALSILAKASRRKLVFFNGKTSKFVLGGLFYILGHRFNEKLTQKEIADLLGISEGSIRKSYQQWLKQFPDLFTDVVFKINKKKRRL